jgi:hypothetical protein
MSNSTRRRLTGRPTIAAWATCWSSPACWIASANPARARATAPSYNA